MYQKDLYMMKYILIGFAIAIVVVLIFAVVIFMMIQNKKYLVQQNKDFEYALYHDKITGHTNWEWLWKKIGHETDETILNYDFVHFDVKSFKLFNELYSHDVGDEVLRFISKKLYEQDFILYSCRCHNDNFAFVTKPFLEFNLQERIAQMFEEMRIIPGFEERPVYYRCGVVEKNQPLRPSDTVADMAKMAQAQGTKPNCTEIIIYDNAMREKMLRAENLKNDLPEAFLRDEILVYFQPQIDSSSEKIVGAEALVRWMYHGKEFMAPYKFIPYLEQNNAINMLDEFVIERVCRYLEQWKKEGKEICPISINLSQKEIHKDNLVKDIIDIVDKYDVDRKYIHFELTETASYTNAQYFLEVMEKLRSEGFSISIDDFGTGYSSFKMLKDMPLNSLKIDKSFVDSIASESDNEKGRLILKDIVSMTKHLNLKCIAEGVEEEAQKDILRDWGCDYIQGYFYSKPIPADDFANSYL